MHHKNQTWRFRQVQKNLVPFIMLFLAGCASSSVSSQKLGVSPPVVTPSSAPLATQPSLVTPSTNSPPVLASPSRPTDTGINDTFVALATQSRASAEDYTIGAGDLLKITLYNVPETEGGVTPRNTEALVSQQGEISLPLLGAVPVVGLTTLQLEDELRERYKKYLHKPEVGVLVKEYRSRQISVLGSVHRPGMFELSGPKTVVDALAMAGGIDEKAGSQVALSRIGPEGRQSYIIDLYAMMDSTGLMNFPVQGGDVLNVPRAGTFFVDGAVNKPGSYPLDRPYTVIQALAVAGGVDLSQAKVNEVTIFRRQSTGHSETLHVNMEEGSGGGNDLLLKADDVVVVPISMPKYLVKRFLGAIGMGIGIPIR